LSLSTNELHARWGLVFRSAARSPFARGAALIEACSLLDESLANELPDSEEKEAFGERVQRADSDGLLKDARKIRIAAGLRNEVAHDAKIPSLNDALTAIGALALADFEVYELRNDDVEDWIAQVRIEAFQNAASSSVSKDALEIKFSDSTCRTLGAAATSDHDSEVLAAVAIAAALLGTALNTLGKSDGDFVYLHIGKKLADERVWDWISRRTYEEPLLDAVMYRNTCVHDLLIGIDAVEAGAHVDIMLQATDALYQKLAEIAEAERQRQAEIERQRRRREAESLLEDYLACSVGAHDNLQRALQAIEDQHAAKPSPSMGNVPIASFYTFLAFTFAGCTKGCYDGWSGPSGFGNFDHAWSSGLVSGAVCGLFVAALLMIGQQVLFWHDGRVERAERRRLALDQHEQGIQALRERVRHAVSDYPGLLARFSKTLAPHVTQSNVRSDSWAYGPAVVMIGVPCAALLVVLMSLRFPPQSPSPTVPPPSIVLPVASAHSPPSSSGPKVSIAIPSHQPFNCKSIPSTTPASKIPAKCSIDGETQEGNGRSRGGLVQEIKRHRRRRMHRNLKGGSGVERSSTLQNKPGR
jgi:hypothetical protein